MTRRTITVTLTDRQFRALTDAVAALEADYQQNYDYHPGMAPLNRAYDAIRDAWYSKERPRRKPLPVYAPAAHLYPKDER